MGSTKRSYQGRIGNTVIQEKDIEDYMRMHKWVLERSFYASENAERSDRRIRDLEQNQAMLTEQLEGAIAQIRELRAGVSKLELRPQQPPKASSSSSESPANLKRTQDSTFGRVRKAIMQNRARGRRMVNYKKGIEVPLGPQPGTEQMGPMERRSTRPAPPPTPRRPRRMSPVTPLSRDLALSESSGDEMGDTGPPNKRDRRSRTKTPMRPTATPPLAPMPASPTKDAIAKLQERIDALKRLQQDIGQ